MIIVTGGAGFIGSHIVRGLNRLGRDDIVIVDTMINNPEQWRNLVGCQYYALVPGFDAQSLEAVRVEKDTAIIHLAGLTDTTVVDYFKHLMDNFYAACHMWHIACEMNCQFIYASSAATYGAGEHGFSDDPTHLHKLKPRNPYAMTKHQFDLYTQAAKRLPLRYVGLKLFNVYGQNEWHKGTAASVVNQWITAAQNKKRIDLFKSNVEELGNGDQSRDFIYVDDVVSVILNVLQNAHVPNGIYNVGSGESVTFNELSSIIGQSVGNELEKRFIVIPPKIRDGFQNFTKADIRKIQAYSLLQRPTQLKDGIHAMLNGE